MIQEQIDPDQYVAIRDLVYGRAGITLGDSKQALVQARLAKRLRVLGLSGYDEYLEVLAGPDADEEIVHAGGLMTKDEVSGIWSVDSISRLTVL